MLQFEAFASKEENINLPYSQLLNDYKKYKEEYYVSKNVELKEIMMNISNGDVYFRTKPNDEDDFDYFINYIKITSYNLVGDKLDVSYDSIEIRFNEDNSMFTFEYLNSEYNYYQDYRNLTHNLIKITKEEYDKALSISMNFKDEMIKFK